jgi:hypothetical protein
MKNISFVRGISQLQAMEHFSLKHHVLYHPDYHDYYYTNGCDVNEDDCGILFRYGLFIGPP